MKPIQEASTNLLSAPRAAHTAPVQASRSLSIQSDEGNASPAGWPEGKWYKPLIIPNEGSTGMFHSLLLHTPRKLTH